MNNTEGKRATEDIMSYRYDVRSEGPSYMGTVYEYFGKWGG